MSTISSVQLANNGAAFLQNVSTSPGGNWVQDTATANAAASADWMDPNGSSSGGDAVTLAANAFAAAQQIKSTSLNSMAVNKGIAAIQATMSGKVNVLA